MATTEQLPPAPGLPGDGDEQSEREFARKLAERYRFSFIDLREQRIDAELFRTIPADLAMPAQLTRPQLLLALHPRCPCSRATVNELAKILSRVPKASDVTVLMYKPPNEPDSWLEGTLLEACRRMHCKVRPDPGGRLAASLGSLTSGGVVLYDANGKLRYQGGITSSRGHEGDNAGERAIVEILQGHRDSHASMPVFGCPIQQLN